MADYYTHFCIELEDLSAAKLEYWRKYEGHKDDDDEECRCFDVTVHKTSAVLDCDHGQATMDHVSSVIRDYLRAFRIKEPVIVPYANTASRSVTGGFDGGVVVVWAQREKWINSTDAGEALASGVAVVEPNVYDYSTPLDELDDSAGS